VIAKPTVEVLGIDPDAQEWQRSGDGAGAIEIAFTRVTSGVSGGSDVPGGSGGPGVSVASGDTDGRGTAEPGDAGWILMRVADDPDRRVLVFDRNEWECFLDGARKGEFDDAAGNATS
jgi:Domain of unknown function (DUF397)